MKTIQESSPYALSIALGNQKLFVHDLLWKLYQKYQVKADQDKTKQEKTGQEKDGQKDEQILEALRIRQASIWALGETRDFKLVDRLGTALQDHDVSVRCLAAYGLEKMVVFESSPYLRAAFERSNKDEQCMRLETPTQIGEKGKLMLPARSYQLTLARALATTDDPKLLTWIVDHQEGIDKNAHQLFYKYYKALEQKEKSGLLEGFKRRNK